MIWGRFHQRCKHFTEYLRQVASSYLLFFTVINGNFLDNFFIFLTIFILPQINPRLTLLYFFLLYVLLLNYWNIISINDLYLPIFLHLPLQHITWNYWFWLIVERSLRKSIFVEKVEEWRWRRILVGYGIRVGCRLPRVRKVLFHSRLYETLHWNVVGSVLVFDVMGLVHLWRLMNY